MPQKLKFVSGVVNDIVEIGENAVYHHFLLFQQFFQGYFIEGLLKLEEIDKGINIVDSISRV